MKQKGRRDIPAKLVLSGALFLGGLGAVAQAQTPATAPSGLQYSAPRQLYTQTGLRLEGNAEHPARLWNPGQLDVKAAAIVFDVDFKAKLLKKVQATKNVSFDLNLPPKGTVAGAHINATCDIATLDPATKDGKRQLTLTGNVDGYYEVGGARNTLEGTKAVITFGTGGVRAFDVAIEGGANGVRLEVPAQMFASSPGGFNSFDTLVITGERATIDQAGGTARILGKARAEGKPKAGSPTGTFLATATNFVVTRDASGQMNTLQTEGRTKMKVDLPPPPATTAPAVPAPAAATTAPATAPTPSKSPGTPTSMEAEADKATVTFSDSKLVFEGNVQGQYTLRAEDGTTTGYNFNGDKVVVRSLPQPEGNLPAGLSVEAFAVTVDLPNIGLGLE